MLFDLGFEQIITVTTEPMLFPLDIAFFSEGMVITEIYRNIQPGYLVTSTSPTVIFLRSTAVSSTASIPAVRLPLSF